MFCTIFSRRHFQLVVLGNLVSLIKDSDMERVSISVLCSSSFHEDTVTIDLLGHLDQRCAPASSMSILSVFSLPASLSFIFLQHQEVVKRSHSAYLWIMISSFNSLAPSRSGVILEKCNSLCFPCCKECSVSVSKQHHVRQRSDKVWVSTGACGPSGCDEQPSALAPSWGVQAVWDDLRSWQECCWLLEVLFAVLPKAGEMCQKAVYTCLQPEHCGLTQLW